MHLLASPPVEQDDEDIVFSAARQLQKTSESASVVVSSALEELLQLESGRLYNAHKKKFSSVIRLLKYSESTATPPHADAAGYVLRIGKETMEIQDPDNNSDQWCAVPPRHSSKNGYYCLLLVGTHLEAATLDSSELLKAPIHRVPSARNGTIRRALTVVINADERWPLGGIQAKALCTSEQKRHDFIHDSEQFCRYMEEEHVPTVAEIKEHWYKNHRHLGAKHRLCGHQNVNIAPCAGVINHRLVPSGSGLLPSLTGGNPARAGRVQFAGL